MDLQHGRRWIVESRSVTGFTGAGISTESGIPDFRSPNGVWARNRTVYYQEFLDNESDRIEYWRQKVESWPAMRDAVPNPGHLAFVELARQGKLLAMITQNIDGLHRRSGLDSELILELHGTTAEAVCLGCDRRISMDEAVERVGKGELAPRCGHCGGFAQARHRFLRPVASPGGPGPVPAGRPVLRGLPGCGLLPGGGAGRLSSSPGQAVGSQADHPQSHRNPAGWDRRPGDPG